MHTKFTLLLLGHAGSGKSAFVSSLSKIDIFKYVTASKAGGANTTKVSVTYEFSRACTDFRIIDCVANGEESQDNLFLELQEISRKDKGIEKIFELIKDETFSKRCINITIELPCKENLIPSNCTFDTIVVRDSRGFGDVNDNMDFKIANLEITDDVNTILFFSISSIQQPAIFSNIVESVMKFNLKTPMILLRRDADLTENDVNFKNNIITNIKESDPQLGDIILGIKKENKSFLIDDLIFNVPEVKQWKGAINVSPSQTQNEINKYSLAVEEIVNYAVKMYEELYNLLFKKMQGEYQDKFVDTVLQQLKSEKALDIVASITSDPCVTPSQSYKIYRDTEALSRPVKLRGNAAGEEPFKYEQSQKGKYSVIPSYSYACVNFRNVFQKIVYVLTNNYQLASLFNTFMSITLRDCTITTYTGYSFQDCRRNAFKFNQFLSARDAATQVLKKNELVANINVWKPFTYTPINHKYEGNKAIAVLMYIHLIDILNFQKSFDKYKDTILNEQCSNFIKSNSKEDILKKLKRK